jgi:hypothetical protein
MSPQFLTVTGTPVVPLRVLPTSIKFPTILPQLRIQIRVRYVPTSRCLPVRGSVKDGGEERENGRGIFCFKKISRKFAIESDSEFL